jgi:hypothetical protein
MHGFTKTHRKQRNHPAPKESQCRILPKMIGSECSNLWILIFKNQRQVCTKSACCLRLQFSITICLFVDICLLTRESCVWHLSLPQNPFENQFHGKHLVSQISLNYPPLMPFHLSDDNHLCMFSISLSGVHYRFDGLSCGN